jgi:hypothetical protein
MGMEGDKTGKESYRVAGFGFGMLNLWVIFRVTGRLFVVLAECHLSSSSLLISRNACTD